MSSRTDELIEDAMRLPEADRIRLAIRVLATFDGAPDVDAAGTWVTKIDRRTREIEQGRVQPVSWAEVKSAATRRARERR